MARENGFKFNEIVTLTLKIVSILLNMNICYYLEIPIPKVHGQFFWKNFQNAKYLKNFCSKRNKRFILQVEDWFYIIKQTKDIVYKKLNF